MISLHGIIVIWPLILLKLWELVVNGFVHITDPSQFVVLLNNQKNQLKESSKKDAKALNLTKVALTEVIFPKIEVANYSKKGLDILQTRFKGTDKVCMVNIDEG